MGGVLLGGKPFMVAGTLESSALPEDSGYLAFGSALNELPLDLGR
jgi:hypothetical protein